MLCDNSSASRNINGATEFHCEFRHAVQSYSGKKQWIGVLFRGHVLGSVNKNTSRNYDDMLRRYRGFQSC